MKNKLIFALSFLLSITSVAQTPGFSWVRQISGGITGDIFILSMTADNAGNLYTAGIFDGTVDFDPGSAVDTITESGFGDIFISKMDSSGSMLWTKHIGAASYDQANSITADVMGNIYVTGFFSGDSVDFDPGPGVFWLHNGESSFVLKLDKNGNFMWAKQIESLSENYAVSLKLDYQNNILVTGKFGGTADFDPDAGTTALTSAASDIYIWKLDHSGSFIWAKQISAVSGSQSYSVASDASGNIFVAGALLGTMDMDPGPGVNSLTNSSPMPAAFILRLDPAGDFFWTGKIEHVDIGLGNGSILADGSGNLYLGGNFTGTVDFDPGAGLQNFTATAGNNCFLLKLNSSMNFSWVKQMEDVAGISLDTAGNIYTCGSSINKFSTDGTTQWVSGNSLSKKITVDPFGSIYTAGTFTGTFDFDPGTAVYNLTNTAGTGTFFHKMKQSSATGIGTLTANKNNFSVYPNPNSGSFYLQSDTPGNFLLTNDLGQVIKKGSLKDVHPTQVSVEYLPDGIYFLSAGGMSSKKIVIQH